MKTWFILVIVIILSLSCKEKPYYTKDYISRAENAWGKRYDESRKFWKLRKEFLKIIEDSITRKAWKEDIDDYRDQADYINDKFLKEIRNLLVMQADTVPWYVTDTLRARYIKHFNETENTSNLLKHGLSIPIEEYLKWFDRIFKDTLHFYNAKIEIPPRLNNISLWDIWIKEKENIKSVGDFEILQLTLYAESYIVLDSMLERCKEIYKKEQERIKPPRP